MNEFANLQIRVQSDEVPKASSALDGLAESGIRADAAIDNLNSSTPAAARNLGAMGQAGAKASAGVSGLGATLEGVGESSQKVARTGRELDSALSRMETGGRGARQMMQNLSWQIQDVAVQAQMGVSSLTVLAQQGPQILSVFGAGGAVAGGLLAVGALLATLAQDADTASDSFDEMLEKLDKMNQAQRVAFDIKTVEEHNTLVQETNRMYAELASKVQDLEREKTRATSTWKLWADTAKENIADIGVEIDLLKGKIADNVAKVKQYEDGLKSNADVTEGMSRAVKAAAEALDLEAQSVNASTFEKKKLNLERELGRELGKAEADELMRAAKAYDAETAAKKANAEADRALKAAARKAEQDARKEATKQAQLEKQASAWLDRVDYYGQSELQRVQVWQDQELQQLRDFMDKKVITAEEGEAAYNAILDESTKRRMDIFTKEADHKQAEDDRIRRSQEQAVSMWLDVTSTMLDTTTTMLEDSGMENSGIMKAMFAMQKALAIPSIIASTHMAASNAAAIASMTEGWMSAEAIRTMIMAQGYASAGMVGGLAIAGLFDNGGVIPAGQTGIVGEFGPEFVKGPAVVTSRAKTAEMARSNTGGNSGGGVTYQFNQTFVVNGNGDAALRKAMQEAAQQGSEDALAKVKNDAMTNGEIRRLYNV